MSMKSMVGAAVLSVLLAGHASAQNVDEIRVALNGVFALDHAACLASLEARKADFSKVKQVTSSGYQMLDHAYEGHSFACEAARIGNEVVRLYERQRRLEMDLSRLDAAVALTGSATDPDRMRSRQLLVDEIKALDAHMVKLGGVSEGLRKAAEGMLELAMTDLDMLSKSSRDSLLAALDVQSQNDILVRLLGGGGTKPSVAT